jgi:hypothetical protein
MAYALWTNKAGSDALVEMADEKSVISAVEILEDHGGDIQPGEMTIRFPDGIERDLAEWLDEEDPFNGRRGLI